MEDKGFWRHAALVLHTVCNQNTTDKWTKGFITLFFKKGDLGIAKNFRDITLTSIATKIYNALLLNCIGPDIEKILEKNKNSYWGNWSASQILTIRQILEGVRAKKPQHNFTICRHLQGIWLHTQRKDGANTPRLKSPQRNRCSHNNGI